VNTAVSSLCLHRFKLIVLDRLVRGGGPTGVDRNEAPMFSARYALAAKNLRLLLQPFRPRRGRNTLFQMERLLAVILSVEPIGTDWFEQPIP
jgi:hypothetical protein